MLKILVPTDHSTCSEAAIRYAASLAYEADGSLIILSVEDQLNLSGPESTGEHGIASRDYLGLLHEIAKGRPILAYEQKTVPGKTIPMILGVAREESVDLIVMGTYGRTGLSRFLMGSVTDAVIRRAPCPVLTIKEKYDDLQLEGHASLVGGLASLEHSAVMQSATDAARIKETDQSPALALVTRGISARASDIHIDTLGDEFVVRFRIDGRLNEYCRLSQDVGRSVMTQIKILSNLDIADPFNSQEGRMQLPELLKKYEVRVTSVRAHAGEALSLRLLSLDRLIQPIASLGMSVTARASIANMLAKGNGLILVTGPTGSGKTTTLYSMLHTFDNGARNIVSIEDPVEFSISSFRQIAVDPKHGTTMMSGLRTLMRLDPDIIFVGEIRDTETAESSMRAASSGRYVFSSLHTRDVASTVTALLDLHVDSRSLAGNLAGIVSQRLVRRLCRECCQSFSATPDEVAFFVAHGISAPATLKHAKGCQQCGGTGYLDRVGIFEVLAADENITEAIVEGKTEDELRGMLRQRGICSLEVDALHKVAEGTTSLEECKALGIL